MPYEAVLFDLDGTLLDTLEDLADSANAALEARGLPTHPLDAYRFFVGDGMRNLVRRTLPAEAAADEGFVDTVLGEMKHAYSERWDARTRPYDGVPALLDGLAERGVKTCIVSNKPHDFTVLCVERLLPGWRFHAIQGVSDDVPPKPDTTGTLRSARTLGVPPQRFLYLGDTNTDMKTANAAGMFAVGAAWGFRPVEELRENGARAIAARPTDLLEMLG
ncbi:MAG: HAD family hydrolase [Phycisphaerae bacterium]